MAESWWTPALREFERHLRAANRRPLTIHGYLRDLDQLRAWMIALGRGDEVPTTADLRAWLAELQEDERAGATLARKRSALRAFFDFAAVERLIPASPVAWARSGARRLKSWKNGWRLRPAWRSFRSSRAWSACCVIRIASGPVFR